MRGDNQSFLEDPPKDFILLGVSDRPWLERPLFVVLLVSYILAMLGNIAIILVSRLDPQLHSPMYIFLRHLSFLDLCYTTTTVPQMLVNMGSSRKTISYGGCTTQYAIFHWLGCTECIILAAMALDRYVAICEPLRYAVIMHHSLCLQLVAVAWLSGFGNSLVQVVLTVQLPFCGRHVLNNFFCEVPAMIKLSCADTAMNDATLANGLGKMAGLLYITYIAASAIHKVGAMEGENVSFPSTVVLLGFSDYPWLEMPLFGVVLVSYILTLMGNSSIIFLSMAEPRLRTPMYFFLDNLSVLDLCVTCTIVPQLLANLWGPEKTIASWGCITQAYLFHWTGCTECALLAGVDEWVEQWGDNTVEEGHELGLGAIGRGLEVHVDGWSKVHDDNHQVGAASAECLVLSIS
ncbi:olfactory receptor 2B11-like [Suricata suricatta]|uniref:olfactory receptor 2B11-like n=1 Tax=Suricata suricatta TaxID=37032 RepID=UPI0011558010|nr:olfactory receptor 2B11-like [Suricata suricatta]